jgi:5'-deoxynucleotidase YfbR-like HD superfamily hydrolase
MTPADSAAETKVLADAVTSLAGYALAFGRIDRTACLHPDGVTPESDSDHTVMLGWIAPALAGWCDPGLDPGLVAQFALIHDAVEVFAGDTPTLRIDDDGRAAKALRERAAADRWRTEFLGALPWLPLMIDRYEQQWEPEARFVRAVDKILPKLVHVQNGCADLGGYGMTADELQSVLDRQRADIAVYAGEFAALMDLRDETAARLITSLREREAAGHPPCPGGCGCRLGTDDADRRECGCDGGCCGD